MGIADEATAGGVEVGAPAMAPAGAAAIAATLRAKATSTQQAHASIEATRKVATMESFLFMV